MRKLILMGVIALAVSGAAVTSSATAERAPSAPGLGTQAVSFTFVSQNSGKCLEIAFEGRWDFNGANQYQCTGNTNQRWTLQQVPDSPAYYVINANSGKCLEVGFSGLWDFNAVNQYQCTGGRNQQWLFAPVGPGHGVYTAKNVNSAKCLEIAFDGLWDFNAANQYQCTGRPNQQWFLQTAGV